MPLINNRSRFGMCEFSTLNCIELNPSLMLTTFLNGDGTNEMQLADKCKHYEPNSTQVSPVNIECMMKL